MKTMIMFIFAFLVIIYIYTFVKIRKKRRESKKSIVKDFNEKYHSKTKQNTDKTTTDVNYKKYITKYNSPVDYITKEDL